MKAQFYTAIIAFSFSLLQATAQQISPKPPSRPESATDEWYSNAAA